MKRQLIFALAGFVLWGCSAADMKMIKEELARGTKNIKVKGNRGSGGGNTSRLSKPSKSSSITVKNSNLPECKGITLHKAFVYHSPMYFQGKLLTTIPVYKALMSNTGKRRKVTFDIYYKQDFGNAKYGTKQPTHYYMKEFGPVTIRANKVNMAINIEKAGGRAVYERIELVACD